MLELDQLPVGYQFSVASCVSRGTWHFDGGSQYEARHLTEVHAGKDGDMTVLARVRSLSCERAKGLLTENA